MIDNLKDLEKLFKICRKKGISEITFQGISVKFGELPKETANQVEEADEQDEVPTDMLTADELMYYAVENLGT